MVVGRGNFSWIMAVIRQAGLLLLIGFLIIFLDLLETHFSDL